MVGWNLEPHVDASWLQTAGCLVAWLLSSKLPPSSTLQSHCTPLPLPCKGEGSQQSQKLLELRLKQGYNNQVTNNKPENQDEDALGKIEQQQDFVILDLTLRVLDSDWELLKITLVFMHKYFKNVFSYLEIVLRHLENVLRHFQNVSRHFKNVLIRFKNVLRHLENVLRHLEKSWDTYKMSWDI